RQISALTARDASRKARILCKYRQICALQRSTYRRRFQPVIRPRTRVTIRRTGMNAVQKNHLAMGRTVKTTVADPQYAALLLAVPALATDNTTLATNITT